MYLGCSAFAILLSLNHETLNCVNDIYFSHSSEYKLVSYFLNDTSFFFLGFVAMIYAHYCTRLHVFVSIKVLILTLIK